MPSSDWPNSKSACRGGVNRKYPRKSKWVRRWIGRYAKAAGLLRTRVGSVNTAAILWVLYKYEQLHQAVVVAVSAVRSPFALY